MPEHVLEPAAQEIADATSQPPFLRDEGEAYARKLTATGVRTTSARYNATLHDVMMLNSVRGTAAAIEQAIHVLRQAFA